MEVSHDDVTDIVRQNFTRFENRRKNWQYHRAAYMSEFWTNNSWSGVKDLDTSDDGLPFKVEVNQIQPFVAAQIASLFYRAPRTTAQLPNVWERTPGRPRTLDDWPDIVTAYLDEWLQRADVQRQTTYAYQLAMMYDASGFKLGIDMSKNRKGDLVSRSWLQAVPRWECIWDEEAEGPSQQAYRGHLRWERLDRAREIVGDELADIAPTEMNDYLTAGPNNVQTGQRLKAYVQILEFYDLMKMEQRFYVITGPSQASAAKPVGKVGGIPYELPSGAPGIPLIPVILTNVPEYPMRGTAAVGRVYQLNAERNLLLTILANAMRRDVGRVVLHDDRLDDQAIAQLVRGRDLELIKIDTKAGGSLANIMHPVMFPPTSPTIDKYMQHLGSAWSDTQGSSDLMQGKQGKYLSATESQLLAGYGEAASGDLQSRMADAVCEAAELQLVMTAEHMHSDGVTVRVGSDSFHLTKDIAKAPWTIGIVDSASTPVKDMKKRDAFLQVQPQLMALTAQASGGPPGPDGNPAVPEAVQRQAQEQLNYLVQLFGLPESMSWDSLSSQATDPDKAQKAKVNKLLERVRPDLQAQAAQQAPPTPIPEEG